MRKVAREIRFCECGCGRSKEVRVTEIWRMFAGHNGTIKKNAAPKLVSSLCKCGCGNLASPGMRYCVGHGNAGKTRTKESLVRGVETRMRKAKERGYYHSKESCMRGAATRKKRAEERGYWISKETKKKSVETYHENAKKRGYYRSPEAEARRVAKLIATNAAKKQYKLVTCEREGCGCQFKILSTDERRFCSRKCYHLWRDSLTKENCEFLKKMSILTTGRKYPNRVPSEQTIRKVLKANCARPNKFEVNALHYLNTIYENKFKYTGDGSFIVNRRSADAYSEELKTVALFHGVYWHLEIKKLKVTEENKRVAEQFDSEPFLKAGYRVIFIWEDELDRAIREKFVSEVLDRKLCKIYDNSLLMVQT